MTLIIQAQTVALLVHAGQVYGDKPFIEHPRDVAKRTKEYVFEDHVIAAAWLHDTMEECPLITFNYLQQTFGIAVANLVFAVTNENGKNRKERVEKTLPKIKECGYDAIGLKLCDRLSNVEASIKNKHDRLLKMYQKEYATFKEVLYTKGELEDLWEQLNRLLTEENIKASKRDIIKV